MPKPNRATMWSGRPAFRAVVCLLIVMGAAAPLQAGLTITITGSGPTDTTPTISFAGSGTLGANLLAFPAVLIGDDFAGGQYADTSYNGTLVPFTGGTISLHITGANNWTSSITSLSLDNDAGEAVPSGGELNIALNNGSNIFAIGDQYAFSGSALLNLGATGRTFSSLNIGNFITSITAIVPSSNASNAFGGQSIEMIIVPEPSSLALLGAGLGLLGWMRKRTRRN